MKPSQWLATVGLVLALFVGLRAQQPYSAGVPIDMLSYFNRTTATGCPTGQSELTAARGAMLVGLTNGGTKGTLVGTALTDQEARTHTHSMSAHTHSMQAHTHTHTGNTGAPSATTAVANDTPGGDDPGSSSHVHNVASTASGAPSTANTAGPSTANTGTDSASAIPYIQLLLCKKN